MRIFTLLFLAIMAAALGLNGCKDAGSDPLPSPFITAVKPDSGAIGSQVKIEGGNFGSSREGSSVLFSGISATSYGEWRDDEIKVNVPSGATTGDVKVVVGGRESNSVTFRVLTGGGTVVSFSTDIQPIFTANCSGCHGSSGGLSLAAGASRSNLVDVQAQAGCTDRKRVLPGNSASSVLYLRVAGNTCGDRMPKGGSALPIASINLIRDWIDQGALDN